MINTRTSWHLHVHLNIHIAHAIPTIKIRLSACSLFSTPTHVHTPYPSAHTIPHLNTCTMLNPNICADNTCNPPTHTDRSHSKIHKSFTILMCTPFNTHMSIWTCIGTPPLSPPQLSLKWTSSPQFLPSSCPVHHPLAPGFLYLLFSHINNPYTPHPLTHTQV